MIRFRTIPTLVFFIGISIFFFMASPLASISVHAQAIDTTDSSDPFTVDMAPEYPTPYQTVTITPSSDTFDIDSATITATVNGKSYYKGSGGEGIDIPVGGPGSTMTIVVSATSDGEVYSKTITVHPAQVALVVEPASTAHPFYAGEPLVASEGPVRLIAIPDLRTKTGKEIDPSTLVYTWQLGDQVLDSDSGIGDSVLNASAPQEYRDADISVTVTSQDGSLTAKAETTISPVDPMTQIYVDDPLMGPLYDNAISGSYTMPGTEETYLGVPYYFTSTPTINWSVNGSQSGTDPDITVRATGDGQGSAVLNFSANDTTDTTKVAQSTVSVLFGQSNSTGLFGL